MKILLDENFPLRFLRRLEEEGYEAEHIITLGQRGISDQSIRERLEIENLLFLTQDSEFLELPVCRSPVVVSKVSQTLPVSTRVEIWLRTIEEYFSRDWEEKLFEVFDDGKLLPWKVIPR